MGSGNSKLRKSNSNLPPTTDNNNDNNNSNCTTSTSTTTDKSEDVTNNSINNEEATLANNTIPHDSTTILDNDNPKTEEVPPLPTKMDIGDCIKRLQEAKGKKALKNFCLKLPEIVNILQRTRQILLEQPSLLELTAPVNIVGDIHGQYEDLLRIFEIVGTPPKSNYLFLGDYVDRGKQSLETILLLFCYKIKYPENFFLLRGNHESASVNRVYGFYDECKRRCNLKIWKMFTDVFNCLPFAAVVAGKIFCVHGGLSPSLSDMEDIRKLKRPVDIPDYGLLNDLLWSDPSEFAEEWEDNERGVSYCFGKAIVDEFLQKHDFDLVARAHMVVEEGYEFFNDRTLVTIFSAPNYCGEFDNKASVMKVNKELLCSFEIIDAKIPGKSLILRKKSGVGN